MSHRLRWMIPAMLVLSTLVSVPVSGKRVLQAAPGERYEVKEYLPNKQHATDSYGTHPTPSGANGGGGNDASQYGSMHVNNLGGGNFSQSGAGTVRVNNLANLEALLNIIANAGEILGITNGAPTFVLGIVLLTMPDRRKWGVPCIIFSLILLIFGIGLPGLINWLVASARDANLFN